MNIVTQDGVVSATRQLRDAQIAWLASIPFDYALTVTFTDIPRPAAPVHRVSPETGARRMIAAGHSSFTGCAAPIWPVGSLPRIRHFFRLLHAKVDRRLFGTRFHALPAHRRSLAIAFPACVNIHPHLHALWRVGADRRAAFEALFPEERGASPLKTILAGVSYRLTPATDLAGWAEYCTKPQHGAAWDDMIISNDFLPMIG
jgi:hypothetical protein